jgi:hypothetical protein
MEPAPGASDGSLTVNVTSGVPEPSTWAMMALGFAGIGLLAYGKRTPRSPPPDAATAASSRKAALERLFVLRAGSRPAIGEHPHRQQDDDRGDDIVLRLPVVQGEDALMQRTLLGHASD